MNNAIVIPGADFSSSKMGTLNVQKMTVVKDGNSSLTVDNGELVVYAGSGNPAWIPGLECAHSEEIVMPSGAKYLFGRFNFMTSESAFEQFRDTPSQASVSLLAVGVWCFHDSITDKWYESLDLTNTLYTRPQIIGYKENLFVNNNFAVALAEGGIYGQAFSSSYDIDKFVVNWFRADGKSCPEVGLVLPEIYVGF